MTTFILIIAFCLVGIPGIAFVILQVLAAHKRHNLAYGWNAAELQRRGKRIAELEQQSVTSRQTIGELMLKVSALRMSVERLEKLIGQPTATAKKA